MLHEQLVSDLRFNMVQQGGVQKCILEDKAPPLSQETWDVELSFHTWNGPHFLTDFVEIFRLEAI
jgi:hypothetical protein